MRACLAETQLEHDFSGTGSERIDGRSEVYRQRRVSNVNEGAGRG